MMPTFSKLLALLSLLATVSCGPTYYKPTVMNIPNFREKDEVHLATNIGTSNFLYSFHGDIQAAYALTNHLAIQANYMRSSDAVSYRNATSDEFDTDRFFSLGECALGYFMPFDKHGTFSIFGGYGAGKVRNNLKLNGECSADLGKLFVQSSMGYRDENIEFIGSIKLAALSYTNRQQTLKQQYDIERFNALNGLIPMIETGWTVRFGSEKVKFQCQATTALELGESPLFQYSILTLSGGICVQLNAKKKSK